jgi:hypothetical protein
MLAAVEWTGRCYSAFAAAALLRRGLHTLARHDCRSTYNFFALVQAAIRSAYSFLVDERGRVRGLHVDFLKAKYLVQV